MTAYSAYSRLRVTIRTVIATAFLTGASIYGSSIPSGPNVFPVPGSPDTSRTSFVFPVPGSPDTSRTAFVFPVPGSPDTSRSVVRG
jgi:hypothetical protein